MPELMRSGSCDQDGCDAEGILADLQACSDLCVQANEQVFGNHYGRVCKHLAEIPCRLQIDCAVKRILIRIDCFE